jgi:putative FmdB family regulatory protein
MIRGRFLRSLAMPIYEYACAECGKEFEHLAKSMSDSSAKIPCPACQSRQTARRLSVMTVKAGQSSAAPNSGHTHSGMCGCGRRPGGMCGS